jgi:hypothetical protein
MTRYRKWLEDEGGCVLGAIWPRIGLSSMIARGGRDESCSLPYSAAYILSALGEVRRGVRDSVCWDTWDSLS